MQTEIPGTETERINISILFLLFHPFGVLFRNERLVISSKCTLNALRCFFFLNSHLFSLVLFCALRPLFARMSKWRKITIQVMNCWRSLWFIYLCYSHLILDNVMSVPYIFSLLFGASTSFIHSAFRYIQLILQCILQIDTHTHGLGHLKRPFQQKTSSNKI